MEAFFSSLLLVLLLTSFVKVLTCLSILRYGLGLKGLGFGVVVLGLSLALSLFVVSPVIEKGGGLWSVIEGKLAISQNELQEDFKPFLEKHADQQIHSRFQEIALKINGVEESKVSSMSPENEFHSNQSFTVLLTSFLITELQEAFRLGLIILIPFVAIDLLVTNGLMLLGITQISHTTVSLPLKLLLFHGVNGWALLSEQLILEYV